MVTTHAKKRIEIIMEAPAIHRLTDRLNEAGVTGYTIVPALAGRGRQGGWSGDGLAGDAGRLVMVISVVDAGRVDAVLERLHALLARQIGIVTVSDVQVLRPDHF